MDQANPSQPPATEEKKVAGVEKRVKVKVLRPFRIGLGDDAVTYDRFGQIVDVPKSEVAWLTRRTEGHAKGFGDKLVEETERHVLQRAELVA
jgi:hypothetical protein